jgi:hypothetical protein
MLKFRAAPLVVILTSFISWADDAHSPALEARSLVLTLRTKAKVVKAGQVPAFVLTIQNGGDRPVRLMDARKPAVQAHYYDLTVTRDGKQVDLRVPLVGAPSFREDPHMTLRPGVKVEFEFTQFRTAVQLLPVGHYQARISVRTHPEKGRGVMFESPPADFTVEK